jgi:hypothetical protein
MDLGCQAPRTLLGRIESRERGAGQSVHEPEGSLGIGLHQHFLVFGRHVERVIRGNLVGRLLLRIVHRVAYAIRPQKVQAALAVAVAVAEIQKEL